MLCQLYLLSFYWGFTTITTVGYGDIVPYTDAERLYSIFAMYCGIALMSIITGKLTTILAQFVAQRAQLQLQLRQVIALLGDAKSSLGGATSSLGGATKSSLGDATKSSLGEVTPGPPILQLQEFAA